MKSIGFNFSDPDGKGSLYHRRQAKKQVSFVYHEAKGPDDTPFQKGLAYWSYYTMVLTSICAFTPEIAKSTAHSMLNLVS